MSTILYHLPLLVIVVSAGTYIDENPSLNSASSITTSFQSLLVDYNSRLETLEFSQQEMEHNNSINFNEIKMKHQKDYESLFIVFQNLHKSFTLLNENVAELLKENEALREEVRFLKEIVSENKENGQDTTTIFIPNLRDNQNESSGNSSQDNSSSSLSNNYFFSGRGSDFYQIKGGNAIYKGDKFWTQLPLNQEVKEDTTLTFKIIASSENGVYIGLIDSSYKNDRNTYLNDQQRPNIIAYWSYGQLQGEGKGEIKIITPSSDGNIISIKINLGEGFITFSVNDIVAIRYESELLKDPTINWLPYISCYDQGQQIQAM